MIKQFGYIRTACAIPTTRPGAISDNLKTIIALAKNAHDQNCDLVLYPELCLTSYTCADLFQQQILLTRSIEALLEFCDSTKSNNCIHIIGLPISTHGQLFNCAAVIQYGKILGVVPKAYIPNQNEFYEQRWFSPGADSITSYLKIGSQEVPFGVNLIFQANELDNFRFAIEICEDLWAPIPPSSRHAIHGAMIILNPSASNELAGKADYRQQLITQQSARCLAAYAYCSAGVGESTTDVVYGGDCMIYENGHKLTSGKRFLRTSQLNMADIDLQYLEHERLVSRTFQQCLAAESATNYRYINFSTAKDSSNDLYRPLDAQPFIPNRGPKLKSRCQEIFTIQSSGLATRLAHTGIKKVIIGLSGGLDSTLALLVAIEAFEQLNLDKTGIHCLTMPGYGTTARTKNNALTLCHEMGLNIETISINDACEQHFKDIKHDPNIHDVTYENSQARQRTQILMNKANQLSALVIGTGDLSELVLGWCTYNGDHMSMYAVNSGVPKTLVKFLIEYYANHKCSEKTAVILRDVLDTPISPELLPPDEDDNISQKTEDLVGPYELHDFFIYQMLRCGFPPKKTLFIANLAFNDKYDKETITKWLKVFYRRFFSQQFKRSCLPDGPKVGSIALSPRGDLRMPSDATAHEWLRELE